MENNIIGSSAFILAVVIAVVLGIFDSITTTIASILVILGLLVGLLNVRIGESKDFMIAGAVLAIMSWIGGETLELVPAVGSIFHGLMLIFIPAVVVVALREMLEVARK